MMRFTSDSEVAIVIRARVLFSCSVALPARANTQIEGTGQGEIDDSAGEHNEYVARGEGEVEVATANHGEEARESATPVAGPGCAFMAATTSACRAPDADMAVKSNSRLPRESRNWMALSATLSDAMLSCGQATVE